MVSLDSDRMSDQELEAERRSAEHLLELHRTVLQSQLANMRSDDDPALLAAIEETQRQIHLAERRRDEARRSLARRHNRIALAH
jgi:hypothetical protein